MSDFDRRSGFETPDTWHGRLECPSHPLSQRCARLAAAPFIKSGGTASRVVLGALKKARGAVKGDPLAGLQDLCAPPIRTNADVVLTHDLDWRQCWEQCDRILQWEHQAGVRSTLNLLTRGPYTLDQGRLAEWEAGGHEIGLHGLWHDPALAYRPAAKIESILRQALEDLKRRPVLFRSPALSVSPTLLTVVSGLGIKADSSLPVLSSTYPGCGFPAPFGYPGLPITEFPLALQDDMLFRDRNLSQQEALDKTMEAAGVFKQLGGTMVINTHPGIIAERESFYRGFLDRCGEMGLRCLPVGRVEQV